MITYPGGRAASRDALARRRRLLGRRARADDPAAAQAVALRILDLLLQRRRGIGDDAAADTRKRVIARHLPGLQAMVAQGQVVRMVLPAFPAKSSNRRKVLGALPDMAERLSLEALEQLCRRIASLHAPGAHIVLCSDGHVFGDLVGVADPAIDAYRAALATMLAERRCRSLSIFSLADAMAGTGAAGDAGHQRRWLLERFGQPLETVRAELLATLAGRHLLCGISRFLLEDDPLPRATRTRARQDAKRRAYGVIQRSAAWSALVAAHFPGALRLSIHPQPPDSSKFGLQLMPCAEAWLTPWHGVAVRRREGFVLMKRHQAEAAGARLVVDAGGGSHFVLDTSSTSTAADTGPEE